MLNQQQLIGDLEQKIANLADLLEARRGAVATDPGEVLAELKARLARFEKIREQQQVTINQLSRTLAVQQVDDALDNAQSRRNVLQRVEEAVRHSRRSGNTCMMIGIDHPETVREEHGSVLYDYMLVQVAQRLQRALRHRDVLLRYGDEAFVLLTDADRDERARLHAERLVRSVCDEPLELGTQSVEPSVSIAILLYRPQMNGANELIRVTMKRLIAAQKTDEQCVVFGSEPAEADVFAEQTLMFEELPFDDEELTLGEEIDLPLEGAEEPASDEGSSEEAAESTSDEEPAPDEEDELAAQPEEAAISEEPEAGRPTELSEEAIQEKPEEPALGLWDADNVLWEEEIALEEDSRDSWPGFNSSPDVPPLTARPEGSALSAKDLSQAMATGVLQAIDGPSGTIATV